MSSPEPFPYRTVNIAWSAMALASIGCITWAIHAGSVRSDRNRDEEALRAARLADQQESNQQALRLECAKLGRVWVQGLCLPKECPK